MLSVLASKDVLDPALAVDEHCILVIRNCGPVEYPGSAEVVNMLPPDYLVQRRISCLPTMGDGRQRGTSASPSILNISPESAVGGRLALLNTGDRLDIDLNTNPVQQDLPKDELEQRRVSQTRLVIIDQTPWQEIYPDRVTQLQDGAVLATDRKYHRLH